MNTHANKTRENNSQIVVSGQSQKPKAGKSSFPFSDNRPEVALQQKLISSANNNSQIIQATQLKAIANSGSGHTIQLKDAVIQRNKHWKRFLNVASFGGRKIYTNYKKKQLANAAQNVPQPQAPVDSPEDQFVNAYGKSRYYHQTDPENLPSIEQHGLLNYQDREETLPENVIGMSRLGGEFAGDEKKGVFLGPKHFMKENKMTNNVARAYLPADRTKIHHWTEEKETPPEEMYRDEKFRGGAVITKNSIPSGQVTTGKISDMLEDDNPKLNSILASVASQYEGEAPDLQTMKGHLREAILKRRLSNAAFDDM